MPKMKNNRQIRALISKFGSPKQAAAELEVLCDIDDSRVWTWQHIIDAISGGLVNDDVLNRHFPSALAAA